MQNNQLIGKIAWNTLITLLYIFLLAPIIIVFIISFDTRQYLAFPPESFSFGSYEKVFQNAKFISAFWRSLIIGLIVGQPQPLLPACCCHSRSCATSSVERMPSIS